MQEWNWGQFKSGKHSILIVVLKQLLLSKVKDMEPDKIAMDLSSTSVWRMKAKDERACTTREVRNELGLELKNVPPGKKSKYISQSQRVEKVADEKAKFLTRRPIGLLAAAVGQLTDEQREVVSEMGLDTLIKLNCGRLKRKLCCWLVKRTDVGR